jgi:dihydrolipoamide dehydrogenase
MSLDLLVIGAGPGGYVCALRAAQLGLKVGLVDKREALGGTCLNVGCIPSKALLSISEHVHYLHHGAAAHGIRVSGLEVDLGRVLARKDAVVSQLTKGVATLVSKRGIQRFTGAAEFVSADTVRVTDAAGNATDVKARHIVIATGSAPVELPFMKFNGTTVVSSDHAIAFSEVPKRLVVVGGGAIGLELGSVWSRFGSEVTVVEFLPKILASYDDDIARTFTRILTKQGIKVETGAKVTGLREVGDGSVILTAERDGKQLEFAADKVLVAVGRRPYTEGLKVEVAGVKLDEKKRVIVDSRLRTNVPNIHAIGDVIAGPMLAHKAEEDGVAVAEWIAGKAGHIDWDLVPGVVYTDPEVASVGMGEDAAKASKHPINVGKFNFVANGRAISVDATEGYVKIIADAKTDRILGAQIIGRGAGDLIQEIVTHMTYGGSAEDLARTIHAHPTMSEAVKEAALAVSKSALHSI